MNAKLAAWLRDLADVCSDLRPVGAWPGEKAAARLREAAAALEAAREDSERWNELCRQIDAGEFHPGILEDALNMGAGALEMHLDESIDQERKDE